MNATENKVAHTPGPWTYKATAGNHDFSVYSETHDSGRDVALVRDFDEANARLIAAAPELLEACKRAANSMLPRTDEDRESINQLIAAIAKATGP